MGWQELLLIVVAFAFAWSMGAHYTGACMGMPYGSRSIGLWPALIAMAVLSFLGATFASHKVEVSVGHGIIAAASVAVPAALVVIAAAFLLTTVYTALRIPTSTIQILVFSVVGAAQALGLAVNWSLIVRLAILWVAAPFIACALAYVFTHIIDRVSHNAASAPSSAAAGGSAAPSRVAVSARSVSAVMGFLPGLLVVVGAAASFTMGANDVSNATGAFLMTHVLGVWSAGLVGGAGLALGVLTWGKPLLKTVAFDLVKVDLAMASAAQWVQALVVLVAVAFGYFTSMNQALVGAMAGAGLARGRQTVQWSAMKGILKGWLIGPVSGLVTAYVFTWLLRVAGAL